MTELEKAKVKLKALKIAIKVCKASTSGIPSIKHIHNEYLHIVNTILGN